jgi:CheY-like chemotaxis protein
VSSFPPGHRILVVDDDPSVRALLEGLLRARGDTVRLAATVEEARAAIGEEVVCLAIVDQQLPTRAGEQAFVSGGEAVMRAIRKIDDRRDADGRHVFQVLVVTGYLRESEADRDRIAEFMAGMFELGADAVVEKPLDAANTEKLLAKVRMALEKAGRTEHAACAAFARGGGDATPGAARPREVRIAIDGRVVAQGRTSVRVDGVETALRDRTFYVVFRCAAARSSSPGGWTSRAAAGIGESGNATTYIRRAFDGLVPDGLNVIEPDRRGNVRLSGAIVVESMDLETLAVHPDGRVARLAAEMRKRKG